MQYYETDSEFREAVEKEWGNHFSNRAWGLVQDFLFMQGIHPPCDDEDIKKGVSCIRNFRGVIDE